MGEARRYSIRRYALPDAFKRSIGVALKDGRTSPSLAAGSTR